MTVHFLIVITFSLGFKTRIGTSKFSTVPTDFATTNPRLLRVESARNSPWVEFNRSQSTWAKRNISDWAGTWILSGVMTFLGPLMMTLPSWKSRTTLCLLKKSIPKISWWGTCGMTWNLVFNATLLRSTSTSPQLLTDKIVSSALTAWLIVFLHLVVLSLILSNKSLVITVTAMQLSINTRS